MSDKKERAVFRWSKEISAETRLEEVVAFTKRIEEKYGSEVIHRFYLEELIGKTLDAPKGGKGYLHVEKKTPEAAGSALLGYAWAETEEAHLLALFYRRLHAFRSRSLNIGARFLEDAANNARWTLKTHLRETGLTPLEKVERIGNLLLGGFGFETTPEWLAPVEDPKIKVQLPFPKSFRWDKLTKLKPQTLSKHITETLRWKGINVRPSLVTKTLEGKASLLETLGLNLLSKL